ncbi:cytochrome c biogenesis protein ResB [bacterium]|nr:cytochrome c biogenesis protein ResB [candidate division CSSED10-310 bacterium]
MIGFLSSIRMTLILLSILAILSIWGTLSPFSHIYYHPGYFAILCLLAVNILICAGKRLRPNKYRFSFKTNGYLLTHLGILVILAGSLISLVYGLRVLIWLGPGDAVETIENHRGTIEKLGFTLILDRFRLDIHPSGMPADFVSDIIVKEAGLPDKRSSITVNHPLKIVPYRIFQSSYRLHSVQSVTVGIKQDGKDKRLIQMKAPGSPVIIDREEGFTLSMAVLRYEPDFVIGKNGSVGSRSIYPRNPAIRVALQDSRDDYSEHWLFLNHPDSHSGGTWKDMTLRFESVEQIYDTGLEVVRDPGTGWVAVGAICLVTGLMLYLIPLRKLGGDRNVE